MIKTYTFFINELLLSKVVWACEILTGALAKYPAKTPIPQLNKVWV